MAVQPPPWSSQRCQSYANEVGEPVHAPLCAVSSCPSRIVPPMLGRPVFVGADAVAAEPTAAATPPARASETRIRMRRMRTAFPSARAKYLDRGTAYRG